ncbi:formylglycine-generating enzyme family protein [Aeromonas veronii]|uniref:formylglycine-generating enzyme family protein n=1 Tax=Aeromonas veronii TaxID=654 RepID=UPI003B9EBCFD
MITAKKICQTEMTDREAMGLPENYIDGKFSNSFHIFANLRTATTEELISITLDQSYSLDERYVAGTLLALSGDPRINTKNPEMILIPGGYYKIGISEEEAESVTMKFKHVGVEKSWIMKEVPEHVQKVEAFEIAKYPVTNQEFREFLVDTGFSELPSSWHLGIFDYYKANHPVYSVSLNAISVYIEWLNTKTNNEFRLPTEVEWEVAASGLAHNEYPWGNQFSSLLANTAESGIYHTTPVGIYPNGTSFFGAHDMAGNVEEYVSCDYKPYHGGMFQVDHLSENNVKYRVARGGSFARFADLARTSRRHGKFPRFDRDIFAMGFRLARNV